MTKTNLKGTGTGSPGKPLPQPSFVTLSIATNHLDLAKLDDRDLS